LRVLRGFREKAREFPRSFCGVSTHLASQTFFPRAFFVAQKIFFRDRAGRNLNAIRKFSRADRR
jgi:hypothetical protein